MMLPSSLTSSFQRVLFLCATGSAAFLLAGGSRAQAPAAAPAVEAKTETAPPPAAGSLPSLTNAQVEGDPLFFIQAEGQAAAQAQLLRVPEALPVLRSATLEMTYEAGKDFTWEPGSRVISLVAGSRIPFKTTAQLHPAPQTPNSYSACRDGKSWMLFGEGRFFHDLQCVASYQTKAVWEGPQVKPAPAGQLPNLQAKLRAGQPVRLVTLGDSISTGANASGSVSAPPMQPGYPDLIAAGLQKQYGGPVVMTNLSVGGMDTTWGITQIPAVLAQAPDAVFIAFGMNDASGRRPTEAYARNTAEIKQRIQTARPGCDVILVATMTANPEWTHAAPDLYPAYATALKQMSGPGCVTADVTEIWTGVLEHKPYLSLSGNGLNHPNDFGHRLYAEVILSVLSGQ